MNTLTKSGSNFFDKIKTFVNDSMYHLALKGGSVPLPGATGASVNLTHQEQVNTDKSKRMMRSERGSQSESIGDRRFIRYANRALKRKNSFCNDAEKAARK